MGYTAGSQEGGSIFQRVRLERDKRQHSLALWEEIWVTTVSRISQGTHIC